MRSCSRRPPAGRALARLHHQGQCQPRRRMHLPPADQPLVRENRDEDQQRHALVLLGRGGRSRRLPRDPALTDSRHRRRDESRDTRLSEPAAPRPRSSCCSRCAVLLCLLAYVVLPVLWTHHEHQKGLAGLPMVTRTAQGIPGDPINVGLIGDDQRYPVRDACGGLVSRRSDHAEILDRDRRQRAARPPLQGRAGQQSLLSRPARGPRLRKAGSAPAPIAAIMSASGRCWTRARRSARSGSALRPIDRGVGVSHYTGAITHHIDADIDRRTRAAGRRSRSRRHGDRQISGDGHRPHHGRPQRRRRPLLHRRRSLDPAAGRGLPQE